MENQINSPAINEMLVFGTFGMLSLAAGIILFIYAYQRKLLKRKLEFQKIEDLLKKQELQSAYALIEGQEIERKRIARDLHDSLSSVLATINMYADTLAEKNGKSENRELIDRISNATRSASEEARRIAHNLDEGVVTHFGLEAAIKDLAQAINTSRSIQMHCHIDMSSRQNKERNVHLYRITQELVNNTLKHANATQINLEISEIEKEYVSFIYEDNGQGFDVETIQSGLGLRNVKSRIESLEGNLTIDTNKGQGTTFIAEIPNYERNKSTTGG